MLRKGGSLAAGPHKEECQPEQAEGAGALNVSAPLHHHHHQHHQTQNQTKNTPPSRLGSATSAGTSAAALDSRFSGSDVSFATAAAGDENPNRLPEVEEIKIQFLLQPSTLLLQQHLWAGRAGARGGWPRTLQKKKLLGPPPGEIT